MDFQAFLDSQLESIFSFLATLKNMEARAGKKSRIKIGLQTTLGIDFHCDQRKAKGTEDNGMEVM